MRIHVKHLNFSVSASALSLLSPLRIFFSNHLAKVAAKEFFINFDCSKGRLQIKIKGNGKKIKQVNGISSNISNIKLRVENTRYGRVFLTKCGVWKADETLSPVFATSSQSKHKE